MSLLDHPDAQGRIFEIGGPDVLRFIDMLERAAQVQHKHIPTFDVPLLTPRLSSAWLALVTDVDAGIDADTAVTQEEVFRVFGEK